jgi:hypothetical protein
LGEEFLVFVGVPVAEGGVGAVSSAVYCPPLFESVFTVVVVADPLCFYFEVVGSLFFDPFNTAEPHVFALADFAVSPVAASFGFGWVLAGEWGAALEVEFGEKFLFATGDADSASLWGFVGEGHLVS